MEKISKATLHSNAREKLEDARALFDKQRYHGAVYICGYVVEFALKARICETLNVDPYPENEREFKTHDLDKLLLFTGFRNFILTDDAHRKLWDIIIQGWRPETRYFDSNKFSRSDAVAVINAVETLLPLL